MTLVLITEDEPLVRFSAEEMLEDSGYQTVSAGNGADAIGALQNYAEIAVLFTDIRLRDERDGGLKLARQARRLHPGILVLYTTGSRPTDKMQTEFVDGCQFLAKPYTCAQVNQALTTLLNASNAADGPKRSRNSQGGSERAVADI